MWLTYGYTKINQCRYEQTTSPHIPGESSSQYVSNTEQAETAKQNDPGPGMYTSAGPIMYTQN